MSDASKAAEKWVAKRQPERLDWNDAEMRQAFLAGTRFQKKFDQKEARVGVKWQKKQKVLKVKVGKTTKLWGNNNIWGDTKIGEHCNIAQYTEIGSATIGNNCKIGAFSFICPGVTIEDNVFIGPHVCFTNDKYPRAEGKWKVVPTVVKKGASIGANSTILCGVVIGENAMIGAGSVITKDVPRDTLVYNPPVRIERAIKRECLK